MAENILNLASQDALLKSIDEKIGEVRTESVDLSFGEIINLKSNDEIRIDPEYQRLFRWSDDQKARLVESVLLRLPIPPIFFIENIDGRLELIDGLQRTSTMIQFIEPSLIDKEALILDGCDIVKELNGYGFENLPLALKLQLKRSTVRAIIIKRQSKEFLRYEMFKRLNTGGSLLSPQEIRNCSARLFGEWGIEFYNFISKMALYPAFSATTESLADVEIEKRGKEELVLRFFAAQYGQEFYAGHVADWLDRYLEKILLGDVSFDINKEQIRFQEIFDLINGALGEGAFCKYQNNNSVGGLAPAHYEAVSVAFAYRYERCKAIDPNALREAVIREKQSPRFRGNVGTGANNKTKLRGRIAAIVAAIDEI